MIKSSVDAKRSSRDRDAAAYNELCRDITPNGCPINRVVSPDDRVDKLVKAREARPDDEEACTSVPCCQ